jgi:hypothetical protein
MNGPLEMPPELAVIVIGPPAETPVTRPLFSMVAMLEALEDHWKTAFGIVLPDESLARALNCRVAPALTVLLGAEMMTLATLGTIDSVAVELVTPSDVAVMLAVPGATPVARPNESMVATLVALLDHAKTPPLRMVPLESFTVAVNAWFWPTGMELLVGVMVMVAICVVVVVEGELPPQPEASTSASAVIASRQIREKIFRFDTTRRALDASEA